MLAAALARCGYDSGSRSGAWVNLREVDLLLRLPGRFHHAATLGERFTAHRARIQLPGVNAAATECLAGIARSQQHHIAIYAFGGRTVK